MIRIFLLLLISFGFSVSLSAQDMDGTVEVVYDRIQGVDPKVFNNLQKSLTEFINNRKWTGDNLQPNEKINCSFFLNLTEKSGNNIFRGTLTVQATRPIYNTTYQSPTFNFMDREIVFKYDEAQTLEFSDQSVSGADALASNLTAVFAYYLYMIVGFDYDSFSPKGGASYFKKAQNIVLNAPEEGKQIRGWKVSEGNRNRYWLVDQVLNAKFETFRTYWYSYHRNGLDALTVEPEKARSIIFGSLPILEQLNQNNPSSLLLQFLFNTKSDELSNLLSQEDSESKKNYASILMKLDVINADKYRKSLK